jgi:hypothetical protein
MSIPGFWAEASVYRTNNHYRPVFGSTYPNIVNTSAVPQGCGLFEEIACGVNIGVGIVLCTAACFLGPDACLLCWAAALGNDYAFCQDCIPGWMRDLINSVEGDGDGGGGGGLGAPKGQCNCPAGTKCCGKCVTQVVGLKPVQICVGHCKATCP